MTYEHLHEIDYPETIKILTGLLGHREVSGFVQLPSGANVNWFDLENGPLSETEKATLVIARGLSTIERCGGFPGDGLVARVIAEAVENFR